MKTDRKLSVGIIGLGVGEKHIEGYFAHPLCKVVSLCDFDKEKTCQAEIKYPQIKTISDADQVLEDPLIDIVSIASYDNYHYSQIVKAINNNKHIFVEKPLCLFENEARHIRELLVKKPEIKMSSNLILRMSPRFRLLKEMICKGEIGETYFFEGDYNYGRLHKITDGWRGKLDFYSVIYGGGVHIIDLILWLSDDHVSEVMTYGNNISAKGTGFSHNDFTVSILKFKSGAIAKVSANFGCVFPHFHNLSVYGTKATFVNDIEYGRLYESRDQWQYKKIDAAYPGVQKGDLIHSFVDSIISDSKAEVTREDVFNTMSVCFAMEKSMQQSRPVIVEYI